MLPLTLMMLLLGTAPETGLYLNSQASNVHLETVVLLEELQARLPGLVVTSTPTQNQGKFYTLGVLERNGDQGQAVLLCTLQDSNQEILFKRSLITSADSLETARQIALVVEGVIKRRGDALQEILKAQQPEPIAEPEPVTVSLETQVSNHLQLDAAVTVGTFPQAKRPTLGAQIGGQIRTWESLYLGVQLGFQQLFENGQSNNPNPKLKIHEWNIVAAASWLSTWGDLSLVTLAGAGISITQSSTETDGQERLYRATDTFLIMRVSTGLSWEFLNNFSLLAFVSADFSPSYPKYTLKDQELLNRGSTSIFGGLGCRYLLF